MPTCALTQGYTVKTCKTPSGTKYLMLTEKANITAFTKTSGMITAMTQAGSTVFFKYEAKQEVINWDEDVATEGKSGAYGTDQVINIDLNGLDQASKTELNLLKKNTLVAICVDNDGSAWYFGEVNGLDLVTMKHTGGVAYTDFRGSKLQFKGREPEEAPSVDPAILAGLLT